MSLIETMKRSARIEQESSPQLQIISQISNLQATLSELPQQIQQIQQDTQALPNQISSSTQQALEPIRRQAQTLADQLQQLPPYLAEQLSSQIEPLTSLPPMVQQALQAFDHVNEAQRRTLDELTQHQRQQLSQRLTEIDKAISALQAQVQPIAKLPQQLHQQTRLLQQAREELQTSSQQLSDRALKVRPQWWKRAAAAAAAGALGAVVAVTGQAALSGLVPPSATQNEAATWRAVWTQATEQERELIRAIVNRQGR